MILDQAAGVRAGEELDTAALERFLAGVFPGNAAGVEVLQFPKGYSNLTYLVRFGERDMVLRRPPFGEKIKSAHDMAREYRVLSALQGMYAKVPKVFAYCEDESVIGAPFYLMERVRGIVLRSHLPEQMNLSAGEMRRLSESFIDNLAGIHAIDYGAAGLADFGKPTGYVRRQVEGWTRRYENAQTDEIPQMQRLAAWLESNLPGERGAGLIHNDYKYDNMVLNPANLADILAVLDWEMATIGDPLMDLGSTLGYWIDPDDPEDWKENRFCLTTLAGNLNRRQLAKRYEEKTGRDISGILFYYVYALFKIAVIVQQIYKRYKLGHSHDERFATLITRVVCASRTAELALEKDRIHSLA